MFKKAIFFFVLFLLFANCNSSKKIILDYIDSYEISSEFNFDGTSIGGISGIDFESESYNYFLISDDRSIHSDSRFYYAKIELKNNKIDTVKFIKKVTLTNENRQPFKKETTDFESIRFHPKEKTLFITDEGGSNGNAGIKVMDFYGNFLNNYNIDSTFLDKVRSNKSFESVCFSEDLKSVFYATEAPLKNDGNIPSIENGGLVRIRECDLNGIVKKELLYELDKVPFAAEISPPWQGTGSDNGLSEILALGENRFLTIERSGAYRADRTFKFTCKVFLVQGKSDKNSNILKTYKTIKREVIDFSKLPDGKFNVEGMTLGPIINEKQSILFVSDNNFEKTTPTMIYLFTITDK